MQEFRVVTNNISAEYGNYDGGVINLSTKSGSNVFHGSAGGHSASESILRRIHDASLGNLLGAVEQMEQLWVYDNSKFGGHSLLWKPKLAKSSFCKIRHQLGWRKP